MKMQWRKMWVKASIWLVTEIILNLLGLDNLADYSEFIFEQEVAIATHQPQATVVAVLQQPPAYAAESHRFTMALNA